MDVGDVTRKVAASLNYARDVGEVLFVNRVRASPLQARIAGEAATVVRQARFHAHARIPNLDLGEICSQLSDEPVEVVTLPGPRQFDAVGNATYYHAIGAITRAVQPRSILEFGTYLGMGTLTMALNAPADARIVTIDLPDEAAVGAEHELNDADLDLIERRGDRVGEAWRRPGIRERIEQVRTDSLVWRAPDSLTGVDLVLIDGGHSTPVVKADTENSLRVLAGGGTILWDDYFHLYPDVVGYLDGLADAGRTLFAVRGTNLVIANERLE